MKNHLILYLLILFIACKTAKSETIECNETKALDISNKFISKKGYKTQDLKATLLEENDYYEVKYKLKKLNTKGGGAHIKISKKNCVIIEKKFFQ